MRRIGVLLPTAADDAVIRPASWGSHLATHRSRPGSTISPPYVKPRCRFETFFETPTFSESNNFAQLADVRTATSNAPVGRRIQ
jgi:hypothetical protein